MREAEASLNKKLRSILNRAGIDLTTKEVQEEVRNFNQYEMKLGQRVHDIIYYPGSFIKYLKNKKKILQ